MNTYLTAIKIQEVRHLNNIEIPLSSDKMKHLILTGKNGSGKTSVLEAIKERLGELYNTNQSSLENLKSQANNIINALKGMSSAKDKDERQIVKYNNILKDINANIDKILTGVELFYSSETEMLFKCLEGKLFVAFYNDNRKYQAQISKHIEKITLQDKYKIDEKPGTQFIKYLVDLKTTQALALAKNDTDKADDIGKWFIHFENILRQIFDDPNLKLDFNIDTFQFTIIENGRNPFDFNQMSSGYAAILDIVADLIMRMKLDSSGFYNKEGIVLIDEIETHLHLDLQKKIMPFLTTTFPNIQFIVTTHSPFILNSLNNAVIFDLETKTLINDGLADVPYDGIVKGYFNVSTLSEELKQKYERYKVLAVKSELNIDELNEISELELYLDEIPDYLALDIMTEYQRLKLELHNRG